MAPPYVRRVDRPTGNVYVDPNTQIPTQVVPAGGLTQDGLWVPLLLMPDGSLVIADQVQGTPHYDDAQATVSAGTDQTLIDETVPALTTRYLFNVKVETRVTGTFVVVADGQTIGSGRTGPGCSGEFRWNPTRPLSAGTRYLVVFTSRLNAPSQGVECYVQASDVAQ